MNCPDCGSPVEKEAQFCPKCYARIEPPTFWQKLCRLFQGGQPAGQPIIKIERTFSISSTGPDGQRHDYHSLDELPPELREEVEKAQAEALKQGLGSPSSGPRTFTFHTTKKVSVFKVKDASGNEQVYHSVEELPPDIRAAYDEAERRRAESSGQ